MNNQNPEKMKALEAALGQIEKQFGKGSVMKLGDFSAMEVEAIPTGYSFRYWWNSKRKNYRGIWSRIIW